MGLEVSEEVQSDIAGRHKGNARKHLIDISNRTQEIITNTFNSTDESKQKLEQMNVDKDAINAFFEKESNIIPKEPTPFNPKKYL